MYLKIGDCPVEGRDHVVRLLDLLGSKTCYPVEEEISYQTQYMEDQDGEDSQNKYDELRSEEESSEDDEEEEVPTGKLKGNQLELHGKRPKCAKLGKSSLAQRDQDRPDVKP